VPSGIIVEAQDNTVADLLEARPASPKGDFLRGTKCLHGRKHGAFGTREARLAFSTARGFYDVVERADDPPRTRNIAGSATSMKHSGCIRRSENQGKLFVTLLRQKLFYLIGPDGARSSICHKKTPPRKDFRAVEMADRPARTVIIIGAVSPGPSFHRQTRRRKLGPAPGRRAGEGPTEGGKQVKNLLQTRGYALRPHQSTSTTAISRRSGKDSLMGEDRGVGGPRNRAERLWARAVAKGRARRLDAQWLKEAGTSRGPGLHGGYQTKNVLGAGRGARGLRAWDLGRLPASDYPPCKRAWPPNFRRRRQGPHPAAGPSRHPR